MVETTKKRFNFKNQKKFTSEYQPTPKAKSDGWKKARTMRDLANMFGAGVPTQKLVEAYKKIYPDIDEKQVTNDLLVIAGQYHKAQTQKDTNAARYITDLKGETKSNVEVIAPIQITFSDKCKGL